MHSDYPCAGIQPLRLSVPEPAIRTSGNGLPRLRVLPDYAQKLISTHKKNCDGNHQPPQFPYLTSVLSPSCIRPPANGYVRNLMSGLGLS
ncbi:unknown [Prevotella sp. CAG:487]|nr:unknown [Prevotella sp. CAG:487]